MEARLPTGSLDTEHTNVPCFALSFRETQKGTLVYSVFLKWLIAVMFFGTAICTGFSQGVRRELSLTEYIEELNLAAAAIDGDPGNPQTYAEIIRNLPKRWEIHHDGEIYTVFSAWLESALRESRQNGPEEARRAIDALRLDALAAQNAQPGIYPEKQKIDDILARSEFRDIKKTRLTILEKIRLKTMELLQHLLGGIFGSSVFPEISKIVIWVLAGAALLVLAIWIYKALKQSGKLEYAKLSENVPVSARPWPEWLERAHEAAAAGDWREAVHLAYWGGISFLESSGLWPPDRARTPREYLRMLPSSNEHSETLASLTRKFEIIWYGGAEAGPESFSESLKFLERLGCHSN
jgi:hypothetical protein